MKSDVEANPGLRLEKGRENVIWLYKLVHDIHIPVNRVKGGPFGIGYTDILNGASLTVIACL